MSEHVLEARELAKGFGEKRVLDGVDWGVPRGSVVGLLGRNGAGKTTLLKLLLGLLKADGGEMRTLGDDPWRLSAESKARIGYVPQEYRPYPWMTAREVLDYTGAFYPRWNSSLVQTLLERWDLDPLEEAGTLSPGQRQKLGLLAALGHEPELLVLDEPAAPLDPVARRTLRELVLDVVNDGEHTVVISTHVVSDLERVADRVSILRGRAMVYDDDLDALKDRVKRLRVVSSSPLPPDLGVPGILRSEIRGEEAVVSVLTTRGDPVQALERRFGATVQVQDLNIEDIFVEMSHV
jgi:ABC-2 type transport system ATP-binding protein